MPEFTGFRSRDRFSRSGVSDIMVRLKDYVNQLYPPNMTKPFQFIANEMCCCELIMTNPVNAPDLDPPNLTGVQTPSTGILSWNCGEVYKTSNLVYGFRQRYIKSFTNLNRRMLYFYG